MIHYVSLSSCKLVKFNRNFDIAFSLYCECTECRDRLHVFVSLGWLVYKAVCCIPSTATRYRTVLGVGKLTINHAINHYRILTITKCLMLKCMSHCVCHFKIIWQVLIKWRLFRPVVQYFAGHLEVTEKTFMFKWTLCYFVKYAL